MAAHVPLVKFWMEFAVLRYLSVPVHTWDGISLQDLPSLRTVTPVCVVMVPGNVPMKAALESA